MQFVPFDHRQRQFFGRGKTEAPLLYISLSLPPHARTVVFNYLINGQVNNVGRLLA